MSVVPYQHTILTQSSFVITDEIKQTEAKYKTKINAESNRQKQLMEETEETHKRWNDENRALVESHQRYLQELGDDYEEKLRYLPLLVNVNTNLTTICTDPSKLCKRSYKQSKRTCVS